VVQPWFRWEGFVEDPKDRALQFVGFARVGFDPLEPESLVDRRDAAEVAVCGERGL